MHSHAMSAPSVARKLARRSFQYKRSCLREACSTRPFHSGPRPNATAAAAAEQEALPDEHHSPNANAVTRPMTAEQRRFLDGAVCTR